MVTSGVLKNAKLCQDHVVDIIFFSKPPRFVPKVVYVGSALRVIKK